MNLCKELFVFSLALQSSNPGELQSIYRNKPQQDQPLNKAGDQSEGLLPT